MSKEISININGVITDVEEFKKSIYLKNLSYFNRNYEHIFQIEAKHKSLGLSQTFKDKDPHILQSKVQRAVDKWVILWNKRFTETSLTDKIKRQKIELEKILTQTLEIYDAIEWESLKNKYDFKETSIYQNLQNEINNLIPPIKPKIESLPQKPEFNDPKISFLSSLIASKKTNIVAKAKEEFNQLVNNWEVECKKIELKNSYILDGFEIEKKMYEQKKAELYEKLKTEEDTYNKEKQITNNKVDKLKNDYDTKDTYAIEQYCEIVLNNSIYPDYFPKEFEIEYTKEAKTLFIEYSLPEPLSIPKVKDVKFVNSKNQATEIFYTENEFTKLYENIIYQIILRTVHEVFEADVINAIESININGWVNSLDKATGKFSNKCIASLNTTKVEFLKLDLQQIDATLCFKNLKGISASKLSSITPIAPIAFINKEDKRFILSKDVLDQVNQGTNLAEMSWEDFEHLIRELFEKEFSINGGEVKVTQASKDGGVDAIAFDPDPIRGGKIVIQAKRYTNTVGVSAVRDLYGTVMNEGATKGILVTTSNYGPDAYEFAKNKPITLLTGNNLLSLLEKHGQKARINLEEARKNRI